MVLSLIVAVARNGVIGRDNGLPWHLPGDLKRFKSITMGKPIIMGRKTFDSIGRPLPGRTNIVLTRDRNFSQEGVTAVSDLAGAIRAAEMGTSGDETPEAMIIGGAGIYRLAMPDAARIYLTEIHADVPGDTYFPDLDSDHWTETAREEGPMEPGASIRYSFVILDRKSR
jgi:dihydrofolate reductase